MAFGSEKRAERRVEEAREALAAEATQARQDGVPLYYCALTLGSSTGSVLGRGGRMVSSNIAVGEALALVEAAGWRLESSGYVFVNQGGLSAAGIGGTGAASVNGFVQGQFIFRPV